MYCQSYFSAADYLCVRVSCVNGVCLTVVECVEPYMQVLKKQFSWRLYVVVIDDDIHWPYAVCV